MRKIANSTHGAAAVEFGLILPLLLAIVFGIIEFGLFMYNQQVITNAAREGARAGIVQRNSGRLTEPEIRAVVMNYLRPPDGTGQWRLVAFGTPNPTIGTPDICTNAVWDPTDYATVTIDYYPPYLVLDAMVTLATFGQAGPLAPIHLSTAAVMKCE